MIQNSAQKTLFAVALLSSVMAVVLFYYQNQAYWSMDADLKLLAAEQAKEVRKRLRETADRQAETAFSLTGSSDQLLDVFDRENLFVWDRFRIVPAYCRFFETAAGDEEIGPLTAFKNGVETAKANQLDIAKDWYGKAIAANPETEKQAWTRVAACLNLLEMDPTDQLRFLQALTYLEGGQDRFLSTSQKQFFRSELARIVPQYAKWAARSDELWTLAYKIEENLVSRKGPYRAAVGNRLCSVSKNGEVYLFPDRWSEEVDLPAGIALVTDDQGVDGAIEGLPPVKGILYHSDFFDNARKNANRARIIGFLIFGGLILLQAFLFWRAFELLKRERELAKERADFVATASHELRTPLSLIQLHAETLALGRVSGEKKEKYENAILSESRRAGSLIENILTFSKQESGKTDPVAWEEVDLVELVKEVAESFQSRAEFSLNLPNSFVTQTEKNAVSQILYNLIDNGVKYSDGKEIEISISSEKGTLEVADRGIGISEEEKAQVFEEFYRSRDQRVASQRGSGIGLTVSRRLADRIGATLALADNKPNGTRVTLTFPTS